MCGAIAAILWVDGGSAAIVVTLATVVAAVGMAESRVEDEFWRCCWWWVRSVERIVASLVAGDGTGDNK